MTTPSKYLHGLAKRFGMISDEPQQKHPGLFSQYMIGLEGLWLGLRKSEAEITADPMLARIKALMAACQQPQPDWDANWRNAWQAEQFMSGYLDAADLVVEAERRLFEAEKLKLASAPHFAEKWKAALVEPDLPTRVKTQRALYAHLLDDLHWLYGKRSLDRKIRSQMAWTVRKLATILFFFAVLPFIPWFGGRTIGSLFFSTEGGSALSHIYGLYTACSFGLLGALFSRLSAFQSGYATMDYDSLMNLFQNNALHIRLLLGMIGSVIVFYAIFGKFLDGDLFPDVESLAFDPAIKADGNFAKLVIWCFLGGFSERLVPDFLSRTESNASKTN